MNTYISKTFIDKVDNLSTIFAELHSSHLQGRYKTQSFNSTKKNYTNIALFFYLNSFKFSPNSLDFNFNRFSSSEFKKISKKQYKEIIEDLAENKIIVVNNSYSNNDEGFSKSYLITSNILSDIKESKFKFNYKSELIVIPNILLSVGRVPSIICGNIYKSVDLIGADETKLDKEYNRTITTEEMKNTEYSKLTYDEEALKEYCCGDEMMEVFLRNKLRKLNNDPEVYWNRFSHLFHQLSKDFREKVLRLDGEPIKEVFDIPASDLHMIAKTIENIDSIPIKEIKRFQQLVKDDFRKIFGTRKDGKCTENTKLAFKKYLNKQKNQYSNIRTGSTQYKIDEYFKENIPNVREFIINFKEITTDKKTSKALWAECMNLEYETMSIRLRNILDREKHIKSLTCHDSIYVKVSDLKKITKQEIIKYFYEAIDLLIDREVNFFNL